MFGQFRDLATTDDGSQLYFSAYMRLRGTDEPLHPKIFVLDANGVRLFTSQDAEWVPAPVDPEIPSISNYFSLILPDVSGDGSMVAFTGQRFCQGHPRPCETFDFVDEHFQGSVASADGTVSFTSPAKIKLSHNGRYALISGGTGFTSHGIYLEDLATGQQATLERVAGLDTGAGRRLVASDGTVAYFRRQDQTLVINRAGSVQPLPVPPDATAAAIDDGATTVVYQTGGQVMLLDLTSRTTTVLAQGAQPALSNDGTLVLYLFGSPAQVWVVRRDGSGIRRITDEPAGILEATLSGDGTVAYASSASNRVIKIDVAAEEIQEVIGPTPLIQKLPGNGQYAGGLRPSAPGSLVRLYGSGFADAGQIGVNVNGVAYPVISVDAAEVRFQVPWEATVSTDPLPVELVSSALFDGGSVPMRIATAAPAFWDAVHGDFSGIISSDSPATAGEIVNFYMLGLGAVTPAVATGDLSPADPPAVAIAPPQCQFIVPGDAAVPADLLFAGLAPGTIGIYQLSTRLPADAWGPQVFVSCTAGSLSDFISLPVQSAPASPAVSRYR